jgi:hypothetical protein
MYVNDDHYVILLLDNPVSCEFGWSYSSLGQVVNYICTMLNVGLADHLGHQSPYISASTRQVMYVYLFLA